MRKDTIMGYHWEFSNCFDLPTHLEQREEKKHLTVTDNKLFDYLTRPHQISSAPVFILFATSVFQWISLKRHTESNGKNEQQPPKHIRSWIFKMWDQMAIRIQLCTVIRMQLQSKFFCLFSLF